MPSTPLTRFDDQPLPCRFPNEASRLLRHLRQAARLNRPLRKNRRNLKSRRGPRKPRHARVRTNLTRVPYHHLRGREVYTYKQSYGAAFVATGLYHEVAHLTSARMVGAPQDTDESERHGLWLLRKDLSGHYVDGTFAGAPRDRQ